MTTAITLLKNKHFWFIVINLSAWLFLMIIPPIHAKVIVLLVFALTGWGMKVLAQPIVSFLIILFIPLLNLGSFEASLDGFGETFIWLLVATFILAGGLEYTGVGKRIALQLLVKAKGNSGLSILFLLVTVIVIGFIIPTASGRTAMIMPVCIGLIHVLQSNHTSTNLSKNIMLGVAFASNFMSWGIITGSNSSIYAVSFLKTTGVYEWTYIEWLLLNFPIMLILIFFLWITMNKMFPVKHSQMDHGYQYIKDEYHALGTLTNREWRIIIIGILTLVGWMTEPLHGMSVALIAMLSAVVSCLPYVGVQTWKQASEKISWDVVILFGAGYALAETLQKNETASWFAYKVAELIPVINPLIAAIFMLTIVIVIRLGFANMLAITAIFLPITINLAGVWNINPVWLSQIVIIACSFAHFLPVQSPSNLITFSYGYYEEKDLLRLGGIVSLQVFIITLIASFYYWPLLGLKP